jgi:hypothetical protein
LKNLIFYEEKEDFNYKNEQDNSLIADVDDLRKEFDADDPREKEKVLFNIYDEPEAQEKLSWNVMELERCNLWVKVGQRRFQYKCLTFDKLNNFLEIEVGTEENSMLRRFADKTNQNFKFKPKIYDLFISRSSKIDELLIYRKDTVFSKKNKAIQKFDNIDALFGYNLQNVGATQNLIEISQLNLARFRGTKSLISEFQFYNFTKFPSAVNDEQNYLSEVISNTFNEQLIGLLKNDQDKSLQNKLKIKKYQEN